MDHAIVYFDGVCNFCNGFVNFMIPRDKKDYFRFAPLQSEVGQIFQAEHHLPSNNLETFYLYENGRVYSRSTAALRLMRHLSALWPSMYTFIILPRWLRDFFYNMISKNRYRWFGKRDTCMVPTKEVRMKFIS